MAKFAERMAYMQETSDVIRYLFESMTDPDTISFGGGAPAKEALPVEIVHKIASQVLTREGRGGQALQYGNPDGHPRPATGRDREAAGTQGAQGRAGKRALSLPAGSRA